MKNQLCFYVKLRSGARTPTYVSCDPICVNDEEISIDGVKKVKATEIANHLSESLINFLINFLKKKVSEKEQYMSSWAYRVCPKCYGTVHMNFVCDTPDCGGDPWGIMADKLEQSIEKLNSLKAKLTESKDVIKSMKQEINAIGSYVHRVSKGCEKKRKKTSSRYSRVYA